MALFVKLDPRFLLHRKALKVGPFGRLLYISGLCYCVEGLTDGFIPQRSLQRIADVDDSDPVASASALVCAGLWIEADDGWIVNDYMEWQTPAAVAAERRAERSESGQRGNHKRWHTNGRKVAGCPYCADTEREVGDRYSDRSSDRSANRSGIAEPEPEPEPLVRRARAPKRTRIASDAALTDALRDIAKPHRVDTDREWAKFVAHHTSRGSQMADWTAAWRNWLIKAEEFGSTVTPLRPAAPANRDHLALSYDWREAPE